jgi:hypothetical protein
MAFSASSGRPPARGRRCRHAPRAAAVVATRAASRWKVVASRSIPGETVAENISVRRGGQGLEDEFQILAKAEVEHLVGLVQDHGGDERRVERGAFEMVAQPARGADDDMRAAFQRPAFGARPCRRRRRR